MSIAKRKVLEKIVNIEPGMIVRVHEIIKEKNSKGEEKEK